MASSMFKNFDYSLINSSVANHKEVLVTYTYKDKAARQYLFIKEVKGKGKDYYLNEAKGIINKMMKNGKLAKESNNFIKGGSKRSHGSAKKTALIVASCILVAGALGAGGYFLGSYLNGGNAGEDKKPIPTMAFISAAPGCTVYYDNEVCKGITPVYPKDETKQVSFVIEVDETHYLRPGEPQDGSISLEPADELVTISTHLYRIDDYHFSLVLTGVSVDFYLHIAPQEFPPWSAYARYGYETYDTYVNPNSGPFTESWMTGSTDIQFYPQLKEEYIETEFAVSITGTKNIVSCAFEPTGYANRTLALTLTEALESTDRFVLNLFPITGEAPKLTTDSDEITLYTKDGEPTDTIVLEKQQYNQFWFKFNSTEHLPADLYNFDFVGFEYLGYQVSNIQLDTETGIYSGMINFGSSWKMNDMILHVTAPAIEPYTASFGTIDKHCTVTYAGDVISSNTSINVYPDPRDEDSVIIYIEPEEGFIIKEGNIVFEDPSIKREWYGNYIKVRNVNKNFKIVSITATQVAKSIATFSGAPSEVVIDDPMAGIISTDSTNPTMVTYSLGSSSISFGIKNNLQTHEIDSECRLICKDNGGNITTFYGKYSVNAGALIFNRIPDPSVFASFTSVEILPTLIEKGSLNTEMTLGSDGGSVGAVSFNGLDVYGEGAPYTVYNDSISIYVDTKSTPTVDLSGAEGLSYTVEPLDEKLHPFQYHIVISGITDKSFRAYIHA